MKKIAVTSEGPGVDSRVDPRFGRAAGFVIVDADSMSSEYVDNAPSRNMSHGAGIEAAQRVAGKGVGVLLTGHVGPKAEQALSAAGIKIVPDMEGMTVKEAVDKYLS